MVGVARTVTSAKRAVQWEWHNTKRETFATAGQAEPSKPFGIEAPCSGHELNGWGSTLLGLCLILAQHFLTVSHFSILE